MVPSCSEKEKSYRGCNSASCFRIGYSGCLWCLCVMHLVASFSTDSNANKTAPFVTFAALAVNLLADILK